MSASDRPGYVAVTATDGTPSTSIPVRDSWALALAALLTVTGIAHFAAPDTFNPIVPHVLPGSSSLWTQLSGGAELLLAIGIALPTTRRVAATAAAVFFVLVLPANVQMAVDWAARPTGDLVLALLRLPLQIPLIWWAWHVRRRTVPATRDRAPTS